MKRWSPALQRSQAARSPAWPGASWHQAAPVGRMRALVGAAGPPSGRACGPSRQRRRPPTPTRRCGMEQLRVPKLLAGGLAAVTGAVVASFFGVDGTLIGAALGSVLVALGESLYTRSLASAHTLARRSLLRRVDQRAGDGEDAAGTAHPRPLRWRRVAVAAVAAFGIAIGVITGVEAVAQQPLASLVGSRPQQGASTSVGVVAGAARSASPATRAPATSATSPSGSVPTTTAPVAASTTTAPVAAATTTVPTGTVPSTTAAATTTPSSPTATTRRP